MRREFCQLAHKLDTKKHGVGHRFLSSKLDGFRVLWDGGVSRGKPKADIPWANHDKDERYVDEPIATGLWSRYGNVIAAPDWFLDQLTDVPFDGEIWAYGMSRQQIRSIAAKIIPDDTGWETLSYHVYGIPVPSIWLADGRLSTPNFEKQLKGCYQWYLDNGGRDISNLTFAKMFKFMEMLEIGDNIFIHPQERLPFRHDHAMEIVEQRLEEEMKKPHAEGLMLLDGTQPYFVQKRTDNLLKVKPRDDAEGIVTGYITGKKTDRGSKLLGHLGALILEYKGKRLELAGFNMGERELSDSGWAERNPGAELPDDQEAIHFPRGTEVTFQYRGLTDDGLPQEAQYHRIREELECPSK